MTGENEDLRTLIIEMKGEVRELRNIVVGEDGEGGIRRDLKHMVSLKDRGLGMLVVLGLIVTVCGQAARDWIAGLIHGGPK